VISAGECEVWEYEHFARLFSATGAARFPIFRADISGGFLYRSLWWTASPADLDTDDAIGVYIEVC